MPTLITKDNVLPQTFNPVALLFKDEGGLAKHPLICHPQGVFGVEYTKEQQLYRNLAPSGHNLLTFCIRIGTFNFFSCLWT